MARRTGTGRHEGAFAYPSFYRLPFRLRAVEDPPRRSGPGRWRSGSIAFRHVPALRSIARTVTAASREVHDERFAVAGGHEGAELRPGQADALGVGHRVEVELFRAEEGLVYDEGDGVLGVVHQPERGRRPGMDVQQLGHRVGGGEPEPASRADPGARRAFRSTSVSSKAVTKNSLPFLSFSSRFLVNAPGRSPRSRLPSSIEACAG